MFKKAKTSLGLEINDKSIKLLELRVAKDEQTYSTSAEIKLEEGIVVEGVVEQPKELAKKIKLAFKRAGVGSPSGRLVHFALPDALSYVHVFRASVGQNKSINKIVETEYQENIPFSSQLGEYTFKVIDKHKLANHNQISTVILVAAKKKSLLLWQDFFESERMKIEFFDIEALAIFRAVFIKHQEEAMAILNIKKNYSKFAIFSRHGLEYETSLTLGHDSAASDFKDLVDKEINKAKDIILSEGGDDLQIDEVILSGDISDGLLESLDDLNFKFNFREVAIGEEELDSKYFQVLGLAKRAFGHYWEGSDPFLPCIGHAYSLKSGVKSEQVDINILSILKKYILMWWKK